MEELYIIPAQLAQFTPLPAPLPRAVRLAVAHSGWTTAKLLQDLSKVELEQLLANIVMAKVDKPTLLVMSLFCVMLANSEGLVVQARDNVSLLVSKLCLYVQSELWARKGYVTVNYGMVTLEQFSSDCMTVTDAGKQAGARIIIQSDTKKDTPPSSPGGIL